MVAYMCVWTLLTVTKYFYYVGFLFKRTFPIINNVVNRLSSYIEHKGNKHVRDEQNEDRKPS